MIAARAFPGAGGLSVGFGFTAPHVGRGRLPRHSTDAAGLRIPYIYLHDTPPSRRAINSLAGTVS